ncbi:General negative regulator of transcription subunit 2 [Hypsizygus marmoreus]|uniref:General negative regulator of transcription subunit 2 n=1 Tax=Hypsizygus marmoreus TaxID=39966 RepID=A0A369J2L6_HYPMA|nr:General negative regulator of transcription subunit 2 [Hypsizygus marmoreus]
MNRPGQPQQRPPSLAQNPGLNSQFRPSFPTYGMPPRNVNALPGSGYVTGLQPNAHRAPSQQSQVQNIVPQSTPAFIQQRGQSSFAFGGSIGQHQSSTTLQQQQQPQSSSHQQQQTNGIPTSLPPHLAQTPNLAAAQSVSSASDVGLDPNDFPALGSTPANNTSTGTNGTGVSSSVTTSYASQAGTALGGVGSVSAGTIGGGVAGSATQTRDFTPDDFPALGGQSQQQGQTAQNQNSSQDNQSHPPGLNGFQHSDASQQQHRQNLLGALGGTLQPGTPGMLNLGQSRNVHPGFQQGQTDAEKQQQQRNNYALKLNQATSAAWNAPNETQSTASGTGLGLGAGAFSNPPQTSSTQPQQNGTHTTQSLSTTHLNAPPGVPPPSGPYVQTHTPGSVTNVAASGQPQYTSNGAPGDSHSNSNNPTALHNPTSLQLNSIPQAQQHPQTPAQQVLVSAADRWGLLGLLAMLKNVGTDLDQGMGGIGTDLGTMGLDMASPGNLYSTFITPWADQSAARNVEPEFHLPSCYANVHAPPPGPNKASAFSDETLFFMFYSSPRDALQEIAAQELWNRNWRYHKDLRLWITKESGTSPSQKVPGGEEGQYTFWDPDNWMKERKEMTVLYADLEEKNVPAFVQGPGLVLAQPAVQGQAVAQHQAQVGGQVQPTQRGSFQMSMASL